MSYKIFENTGTALMVVESNDLETYLLNQMSLMAEINNRVVSMGRHPVFDNISERVISTEIISLKDGTFKIARRSEPIFPDDWDLSDHRRIAASMRSYSERLKIDRGRGKFNDAWRLIEQDSSSVEVKEIAAIGNSCL